MKVVFSGGGTGGHIYPALAIREALLAESNEELTCAYLGVAGGMEEKIVSRIDNLPFWGVRAQGMPRTLSLKWLTFPFVNFCGIVDALNYLRKFRPDIVVTTGGFVAFPALMAARLLGIKTFIHEQNAAMGITNRLFAGSATRVFLTYGSAAKTNDERVFLVGNPVRSSFLQNKTSAQRFKKKADEFWILAVGGSRGALSLNKTCIDLVKNWLPKNPEVKLLHICGERDFAMVQEQTTAAPENYILLPYLHDMKEAFTVADLILSRAGATILAEISVCAKPAILVPFPFATDNHQEKNARALEELGAARVVLDAELSAAVVAKNVARLRSDDSLAKMSAAMSEARPIDVEKKIAQQILACS
jgi:UDP-N-acetylglucosamine--N-acetylmuramyl-(pentapeptide) pyrophosphoryl-undecaprenol N-acetylglucosamine transferase